MDDSKAATLHQIVEREQLHALLEKYAALRFEAILRGRDDMHAAAEAAWEELEAHHKEHPY